MKAQALASFRGLRPDKSLVMAACLMILLVVVPVKAHSQEQGDTTTGATQGVDLGVVSSNLNPLQIALLHWYGANQTTNFTVGSAPFGVAFDGANVWIANFNSNNVTQLRANDGAILG